MFQFTSYYSLQYNYFLEYSVEIVIIFFQKWYHFPKQRYSTTNPCLADPLIDARMLSVVSVGRPCLADPLTDARVLSVVSVGRPCLADPLTDARVLSVVSLGRLCLADPLSDACVLSMLSGVSGAALPG